MTYSTIAKIGLAQPKTAKPKVMLVYPKDNKKDQSSEETNRDLRNHLQPQDMNIQINRMSNIRNGEISLEVPTNKAEDLIQKLKQGFETRQPKQTNKKFKIVHVAANLDKEQFIQAVYDQNFSTSINIEQFKDRFSPLFKTGPRDESISQWIVEIGKEVRNVIPETERIYIEWQACKVKRYTIVTRA